MENNTLISLFLSLELFHGKYCETGDEMQVTTLMQALVKSKMPSKPRLTTNGVD